MPTYIAMLRGINVSGQKLIKMERLRGAFEELGFGEVETYIQSGNVIFKTAKASAANLSKKIEGKILSGFGFLVPVIVRTPAELGEVLKRNLFLKEAGIDESKLHVTFLSEAAPKMAEKILQPLTVNSEQVYVCGREIYLHFPDGYGVTKLSNSVIEKKLSVAATTRNWKTVNVLFEMVQ